MLEGEKCSQTFLVYNTGNKPDFTLAYIKLNAWWRNVGQDSAVQNLEENRKDDTDFQMP